MKKQYRKNIFEILYLLLIVGFMITYLMTGENHTEELKLTSTLIRLITIEDALCLYKADFGYYPEHLELLLFAPRIIAWKGPYIRKLNMLEDAWGFPFKYYRNEASDKYTITSNLCLKIQKRKNQHRIVNIISFIVISMLVLGRLIIHYVWIKNYNNIQTTPLLLSFIIIFFIFLYNLKIHFSPPPFVMSSAFPLLLVITIALFFKSLFLFLRYFNIFYTTTIIISIFSILILAQTII